MTLIKHQLSYEMGKKHSLLRIHGYFWMSVNGEWCIHIYKVLEACYPTLWFVHRLHIHFITYKIKPQCWGSTLPTIQSKSCTLWERELAYVWT